ncbi:MAG: choice-of-anchor B family protein [Bacteroidetes bacterium]|nr:choice-of-anchor B family protein [Bacteroidota bacterium]
MRKRLLLPIALLFLAPPAVAQYALQFGAAVATDGESVYVGEGRNLLQSGSVFVFAPDANGHWVQTGAIQASDPVESGNGFGRSISLAGTVLAVGAPLVNTVYVFERQGDAWTESARLTATGAVGLGSQVTTDGIHIVATAAGGQDGGDGVHTWRRSGQDWVPSGALTPSLEGRTGFGSALDLGGGRLAVGAPGADGQKGAVEVFSWTNGSWTSEAVARRSSGLEGDALGASIILEEAHMVVGMPGHDGRKGAAGIFFRNPTNGSWDYQYKLEPFDSRGSESFGTSLAFDGSAVWVGAPGYGDSNGALYRFTIDDQTMRMGSTELVQPADLQYRSGFGGAIAVSAGMAIVGSTGHDNFEGAAFPAVTSPGGWAFGSPVHSDSGVFASVTGGQVQCMEGEAGEFDCAEVDMVSFLSRSDVGAKRGIQMNDLWGWTDPDTGIEYAIIGRTDGTSFISLADPENPRYLGDLPHTASGHRSLWRDMKTYGHHVYIVADGAGAHHMQIFDLHRLRDVGEPQTFTEDAIYRGVFSTHNLFINEETGFAYAVGSDSGGETCGGALHMADLKKNPLEPEFVGCFNEPRTGRNGSGATHDVQCVVYRGPDADYAGQEICLSANGTALSIADVTDKANPMGISIAEYPNTAYTHQGWLTEDHQYFYLNDEGDEASGIVDATRTMVFDLTDLDEPVLAKEYFADNSAIDHDLYIRGNLMYQTNYLAGLRIIDISDPVNPVEVGSFDTVPYGPNDNSPVLGAWSSYPYFKSGVIVVTSGREGVFFLKKREVDL